MLSRRNFALFTLTLAGLALPGRFASAQDGGTARVGTVNPARIFNEMQETKDLKQKMENDRKNIEDEEKRRVADVEEAKKRRGLFTGGTEEFNKANKELIEKAVSLQTWRELIKADLQTQQKTQMKNLFEKIEAATKDVAMAKKYDIIVVQNSSELPAELEQLNVDQVRGIINQRTVMYNNGKYDITNEVLAAVDAKYKTRK